MKNKHAIEPLQVVKHHNNLPLLITVRHIDQIIQIVQKLQGTNLTVQYMNGLFFRRRIAKQIGHENTFGFLHGFENRIDEQWSGWCHHATFPLCICGFLGVPLFLYDGLNVILVVIDENPFVTHGTFGVPTPVALVWNARVLGLAIETGFHRLTLVGHNMMAFTRGTVKLAVTQCAIIRGPGTTHIIPTVKSATRGTTILLTGMISAINGVERPFTVQTIIRTIHEGRKRGATIKMIVGFQ